MKHTRLVTTIEKKELCISLVYRQQLYLSILRNSSFERNPFPSMSYILNISLDFSSEVPGKEGERWSKKYFLLLEPLATELVKVFSKTVVEITGL